MIGAGAGLSTSAGLTYNGERFDKYFFDFAKRFGIRDIYSGGFYPFPNDEIRWAWWARHIYYNRFIDAPKPVYQKLLSLVDDKDYFVISTSSYWKPLYNILESSDLSAIVVNAQHMKAVPGHTLRSMVCACSIPPF